MNLYQRLHAAVHAKNALLKVHHCVRNSSVSLSWVTPTFELYCVAVAGANRAALASSASAIAAWVKREEERLFIGGVVSSPFIIFINGEVEADLCKDILILLPRCFYLLYFPFLFYG